MADNVMPSIPGAVPNPDPTLRTVEQLLREIANARELIESKIDGNHGVLEARLDGQKKEVETQVIRLDERFNRERGYMEERMTAGYKHVDTAIVDLRDAVGTRISAMDKATVLFQQMSADQLAQLKQLHQEKFDSIAVQFAERDTRTEQTAAGVKIAVDAALQAAKEAVAEQNRSFALATGKSETATMKQIDALGLAIQTANKGLDDKIADMKDRLTRIEGMDLGASRRSSSDDTAMALRHGGNQNAITVGVGIIAALSLSVAVYAATRAASSPPPQYTIQQGPSTLVPQHSMFLRI